MHLIQVAIALHIVIEILHFVGRALEAHAHVAGGAGHSVAAIRSNHWDLAFLVGASSHSVLLEVLLEEFFSSFLGLLAGHVGVVLELSRGRGTLHSGQ